MGSKRVGEDRSAQAGQDGECGLALGGHHGGGLLGPLAGTAAPAPAHLRGAPAPHTCEARSARSTAPPPAAPLRPSTLRPCGVPPTRTSRTTPGSEALPPARSLLPDPRPFRCPFRDMSAGPHAGPKTLPPSPIPDGPFLRGRSPTAGSMLGSASWRS